MAQLDDLLAAMGRCPSYTSLKVERVPGNPAPAAFWATVEVTVNDRPVYYSAPGATPEAALDRALGHWAKSRHARRWTDVEAQAH